MGILPEQREAAISDMLEALRFYATHGAGCKLIHSGGDVHRHALSSDGGARAAKVLQVHSVEA